MPLQPFLLCDLAWEANTLVRALVELFDPAVFKLTLGLTL
jgi:hypothetical protein